MREIEMVDLKAQYERYGQEIDDAIRRVLKSAVYIRGPEVRLFEEELQNYLGVKHVIACANGTDALQIAMMALELKPGDEVITTNFTFGATVEVVALLGMRLVLTDPWPDTYNISPEAIRKSLSSSSRAIVPVHLFGQCADMEEIMNIAGENGLYVIEDAAQATGTDFIFSDGTVKKAGTIGHIGTTSFFPSKNLACFGDGGALYTNNDDLAVEIRSIANHGMKTKYHYDNIGVNSRLDTLQAAILRVRLRYLERQNTARRGVADSYDRAFAALPFVVIPARAANSTHIFHQYTVRITNGKRDQLRKYLEENKIPSMIYYPAPLHTQNAYRYLGYGTDDFPATSRLCNEVLSLPMHPEMEPEQIEYITATVCKFFE